MMSVPITSAVNKSKIRSHQGFTMGHERRKGRWFGKPSFVGNLVVVTWGCHGRWTGRRSTDTSEPISARISYYGQGRIVSYVLVSWLARA